MALEGVKVPLGIHGVATVAFYPANKAAAVNTAEASKQPAPKKPDVDKLTAQAAQQSVEIKEPETKG
jgi:hypothetical protein